MEIIGLIARSHNLPIRRAVDFLEPNDSRDPFGIHAPFIMGVLRIADYVQIHAERAPGALLHLRSLRSPISSAEWRTHLSVQSINNTQNDPEAIYVRAAPTSASIFLKLRALLDSIQTELDETWATLGEIYGRFGSLSGLGLGIRRVRSNIDDVEKFGEQVSYIPRHAAFSSAGAELLKLLIKPLYGDQPEIGIRELVQNAVDAVRERRDLDQTARRELQAPEVTIDLVRHKDSLGEVIVRDYGVGMTASVITDFFLKAGASFRRSMAWRQQHTSEDGTSRVLRSGRFGIGALAAFLLGERIEVTTRHVSEPRGISFSARVDDTVVELRRVDCEVGTTIRIPISDPATFWSLATAPKTWDWYCCEAPAVRRAIDGVLLRREFTCPDADTVLPSTWRRIATRDYNDLQWTFAIGNRAMMFCNGIRVGHSARMASATPRELMYLHRGDDAHLTVRMPSVSVFDADANLPLDLQRSGLATAHYPFQDELLSGVLSDFVAFAVVNAPQNPREFLEQRARARLAYAGIVAMPHATLDHVPWLWFWHNPAGLALSDPWAFGLLKPSRVMVLQRPSSFAAIAPLIPLEQESVVPLDCRTNSFKDTDLWLRWAFGESSSKLGMMGTARATGVCALISTACFEEMRLRKKAWAITAVASAQRLSEDWYLVNRGLVNRDTLALDYEALARVPPATKYEAIAEVYLYHSAAPPPDSVPAQAWQRILGSPIIPYDVFARQRLIESLPNTDDVRAHQERRAELERENHWRETPTDDDE
jgi:hypothetical protein